MRPRPPCAAPVGSSGGLLDVSRIRGCHTPLTLVFSPQIGLMTVPSIAGLVTATYALKRFHHSDAGLLFPGEARKMRWVYFPTAKVEVA